MKKKTLIIFLFILFGLSIPIAMLGSLMTLLWFVGSIIKGSSFVEIIMSFLGIVIGTTYIATYIYSLNKTLKIKKISPKTFFPVVHCIIALLYLLSLVPAGKYVSNTTEYFGFAKKDFVVIEEVDTHGGFHGDGHYYLVLDCSANKELAQIKLKNWHELPLPETLNYIVFGTEIRGTTYRNGWAEEASVPIIKNGYYMFKDRHSESNDSADASQLHDRCSYNFSVAVYDCDTNKMYYFEFDT